MAKDTHFIGLEKMYLIAPLMLFISRVLIFHRARQKLVLRLSLNIAIPQALFTLGIFSFITAAFFAANSLT